MDKVEPPFTLTKIGGNLIKKIRHIVRESDGFYIKRGEPWGADDDTDIEYMYQHLLDVMLAYYLRNK